MISMKKYILLLFLFIISLSSFGKKNVYLIVHKDTKIESGKFFVSAMDTNGNEIISDNITTTSSDTGDYKIIKVTVDSDEEKIKVAAGYLWPKDDDFYVLLANESAEGLEEVRDSIVENDTDGDYDYLDILNTSYYSTYANFPGVEVTSDVRFFAMPVKGDSSNISSNIYKEIPFPAPFEIVDGKIITTDEYEGTVTILESAFNSSYIAGAIMMKRNGETTRSKISSWYEDLKDDIPGYVDWSLGDTVNSTNTITEYNSTKGYYTLIKSLSLSVEGDAGDEITIISRYQSSATRDSGDSTQIIDDTDGDSFTGEYIFVKKNGDTVLPIPGLDGQIDLSDAADIALTVPEGEDPENPSYYDVDIGVNDALLLFEHGGSYSSTQAYSDMQDLVVLIELYPKSGSTKTMTFIVDDGVNVSANGSVITRSSGSERQRESNIGINIIDSTDGDNSFKIKGISK
jgi:hypothetical protein